ncbi:MAG: hypothetical protein KF746_18150 [Chitinophagaceae bacterium]|nr:hypothetical protein [Chitinophagaceae bacterium]
MNQKLPYEKLIAEKMQELPVLDVNTSWQQMKRRLDEEMPLEGGSKKRPGGGWWWKSGLVILVTTAVGTYFFYNTRDGAKNSIVKTIPQEQTIHIAEQNETITPIDQTFTPSVTNRNNKSETGIPGANTVDPDDLAGITSAIESTTGNKKPVSKNSTATFKKSGTNTTGFEKQAPIATGIIKSRDYAEKTFTNTPNTRTDNTPDNKSRHLNTSTAINEAPVDAATNNNDPDGYSGSADNATRPNNYSAPALTGTTANSENYMMASVPSENISYSNHLLSTVADSLAVPATVWQLPDVTAQKKAILKEMRKQEKKQERELAKSYRSNSSFWGEQPDRWFAAGLAPYQNVSIGSQQTYNYNSAGNKNIVADYIPAPYLQLHITNKVYVLSEFQFNAPQSTPSLLLSQKQLTVPMNTIGYTESTYLRKLYYFNMPVSFYYSPVKNFYIGSGMQFSSFNSGLAYMEQRAADNSLVRSENIKIKDDSLSSKITSSEWRYLFDANYYVNRFMFGFRYNQALNDFMNIRINNSSTPVHARNQSFQLYLRYNIIVSDRRK